MNFRPGRVVEAEIRRKFGSPVCHDLSASSPEFFLVLSFGRCQFRLTELSATNIPPEFFWLLSLVSAFVCLAIACFASLFHHRLLVSTNFVL